MAGLIYYLVEKQTLTLRDQQKTVVKGHEVSSQLRVRKI